MSEGKWTPGPWRWWTSNSWRRLKRDDRGISQNVLEPYVMIDGHPDVSVSDADMAMIAAAPELYEALQDLLDSSGGSTGSTPASRRAVAALAKARGEAP